MLAAIALGFWSQLGALPLFDLDEGAFSEATVEMVHSGDYLSPTLNGEPRYDKPILIYWLQAVSIRTFGVNEFAFRLPSAICATIWLLLVYGFVLLFTHDARGALLAGVSLGLSLMSGLIGHAAIADALLNALLAATMLGIYSYSETPTVGRVLRVYLWMGLGFLAKGPIAVALPLATSLLFFLWQRRPQLWLKAVFNPLGWLLFAGVLAPWIYPLWQQDHGAFLGHFLREHNINRYENTLQGHGGKPWYYLVWLPLIVLPFTALLPAAFARARRADPLDAFLLIWFALVFLLFSFSATQLPHYLLYGATPLFILFGRSWRQMPSRVWVLLPALLMIGLLTALPWILPRVPVPETRPFEAGILNLAMASFDRSYYYLAGIAALATLALLFVRHMDSYRAVIGAAFAFSLLMWFGVVPVVARAQQDPVRDAAGRARELKLPVVSYRTFMPSFSVYRGEITPNRIPEPGELVFIRLDRIADLEAELGDGSMLIPEFKRGGVALLMRSTAPATPEPSEDDAPDANHPQPVKPPLLDPNTAPPATTTPN